MASRGNKESRPGQVRIIGGRWRRRRLPVAGGDGLRPTPDRVRETLFGWLTPELPGARCLDLFAGTGALGFEALSRGARQAVFVETSRSVAAALAAARRALEADAIAEIVRDDAAKFLQRRGLEPFDIVFVDPPYAMAVDALFERLPALLAPGARIYLERERRDPWPAPAGFEWLRRGTAGAAAYGLAAALARDPV